jgi:hypothetical protein
MPPSSYLANGSSEQVAGNLSVDEVDGHLTGSSDVLRTRAAIDHMQSKIGRTRDLIRGEQTARDGMLCRNVLICAVCLTLGNVPCEKCCLCVCIYICILCYR